MDEAPPGAFGLDGQGGGLRLAGEVDPLCSGVKSANVLLGCEDRANFARCKRRWKATVPGG